jgi:uncharacterized protein YcgI (DUF1989 family)
MDMQARTHLVIDLKGGFAHDAFISQDACRPDINLLVVWPDAI